MSTSKKITSLLPIFLAGMLAIGIYLGSTINFSEENKINRVLTLISNKYVDEVNENNLEELAVSDLLQSLDPHSYYISAEEEKNIGEQMSGKFQGIGVQYMIYNDTITITNVIKNGPAYKAGILIGDRIISADGIVFSDSLLEHDSVTKHLKGPAGSHVDIKVYRKSANKTFIKKVTRGIIPIKSITAKHMISKKIGYIKVERFAATTSDEFINAAVLLNKKGMTKLILDLRNNGGGYMDAAVSMVDQFLDKDKLIVYTEGRKSPREEFRSTPNGVLKKTKLIVLINSNSASASEIVAGAIQDNDRGLVIGRRSFGKGLVQESLGLNDGSSVRITVARYYTPTGRSIQKPYGNGINYEDDNFYTRYQNGELTNADSIKVADSLKFTTPGGKVVYGGGGIMPDVFVPIDSLENTPFLNHLFSNTLINRLAFDYFETAKNELNEYESVVDFIENYKLTDDQFDSLINASGFEQKYTSDSLSDEDKTEIEKYFKANIAQYQWPNEDAYYKVVNHKDNDIKEAINNN